MQQDLKKLWYKRLKDSGFKDIETPSGALKSYDRRTIAFENMEVILSFHLDLETYLNSSPPRMHMSDLERKVLELYGEGKYLSEIAENCDITRQWVSKIINKYKIKLGYKTK